MSGWRRGREGVGKKSSGEHNCSCMVLSAIRHPIHSCSYIEDDVGVYQSTGLLLSCFLILATRGQGNFKLHSFSLAHSYSSSPYRAAKRGDHKLLSGSKGQWMLLQKGRPLNDDGAQSGGREGGSDFDPSLGKETERGRDQRFTVQRM